MIRHSEVHKGDRFYYFGDTAEVIRRSAAGWVDIRVHTENGTTWTKRMPHGIPFAWPRVTR